MIFAPLVIRVVQNRELIRCQQRPDLIDGCHPVWLETGPDLLQLFARCLNLRRVLRFTRLPVRLLGGINPGLVGCLVLLAGPGKVILDWLQLGSLLVGKLQLLLEPGWKEGSFAQRPVIFKRFLVFPGLGEGVGAVGVGILRQQCGRGQHQLTAEGEQGEFGFHVFPKYQAGMFGCLFG